MPALPSDPIVDVILAVTSGHGGIKGSLDLRQRLNEILTITNNHPAVLRCKRMYTPIQVHADQT